MAEEGLSVIERRFGVDRRKSVPIVLVIVLLLAAILSTRLLAGVPAASLPLRDLAVLVDPAGTETIASVSAALGRFKPVKGDFSAGFTRDVHWLRFTVQAPSAGPRWLEVGARQGGCRLCHAANGCLSLLFRCASTTESRSGLRVTAPTGDQSRVLPDQRAGLRSRASWYSA